MSPIRSPGGRAITLLLPLLLVPAACKSTTEPRLDTSLVVGTYTMTTLRFDPQGSLPDVDVLATLGETPQLSLTAAGQAQITFRDPVSTLVVVINGTYRTTATGVRLEFPSQSAYRDLLLSQRMDLTLSEAAGTLTFNANAPDGVQRARLIVLVPAFENEQLLDPVPGTLRVTFTRTQAGG
jgi:hypothetical protein